MNTTSKTNPDDPPLATGDVVIVEDPIKDAWRAIFVFDAWGDGRMARVCEVRADRLVVTHAWSDLLRRDPDQSLPCSATVVAAGQALARVVGTRDGDFTPFQFEDAGTPPSRTEWDEAERTARIALEALAELNLPPETKQ